MSRYGNHTSRARWLVEVLEIQVNFSVEPILNPKAPHTRGPHTPWAQEGAPSHAARPVNRVVKPSAHSTGPGAAPGLAKVDNAGEAVIKFLLH